jgi:hypothetical protein
MITPSPSSSSSAALDIGVNATLFSGAGPAFTASSQLLSRPTLVFRARFFGASAISCGPSAAATGMLAIGRDLYRIQARLPFLVCEAPLEEVHFNDLGVSVKLTRTATSRE